MFTLSRSQNIALSAILIMVLLSSLCSAQNKSSKVDYSQKSNFIHPDTLRGDQKAIFWHFVDLSSKELKDITPSELKSTFAKLGIVPGERQRFIDAYFFYANDIEAHKTSCENWQDFKYLAPK